MTTIPNEPQVIATYLAEYLARGGTDFESFSMGFAHAGRLGINGESAGVVGDAARTAYNAGVVKAAEYRQAVALEFETIP
jgi:hypothetical protein